MSEQSDDRFDPYHVWLGIPQDEQPANAYRLLGIPLFENNLEVIASAADRQMAHLRTFQNGRYSSQSQKLLNDVAAAKVRLLRPATKTAYDDQLKKRLGQQSTGNSARSTKELASAGPQGRHGEETKKIPRVAAGALPIARSVTHAKGNPQGQAQRIPGSTKRLGATKNAGPTDALSWIGEVQLAPSRSRAPSVQSNGTWLRQAAIVSMSLAITVAVCVAMYLSRQPDKLPDQTTSSVNRTQAPESATLLATKQDHQAPLTSEQPGVPRVSSVNAVAVDPSTSSISSKTTNPQNDHQVSLTTGKPGTSVDERLERLSSIFARSEENKPAIDEAGPTEHAASEITAQSQSAAANRHPVPDAAGQDAMRRQIRASYDPAKVRAPRDKLKLATQFLAAAAKSRDTAEQFMLLKQTIELASETGDAALMIEAIDMLCSQFDLDLIETKETVLTDFSRNATSTERIRSLVAVSSRIIDQALAAERYESALHVAEATARACQRSLGKDFRKEVNARRDSVRAAYQQREELRQAMTTLEANNDNESANWVVARWHCFVNDDWNQGLPYLAKSADPSLRGLAEQELSSSPTSPEEQMALADAWWELAKGRKGDERNALFMHAGHWYEQSLMGAVLGLTRLKVEKRLEELGEIRHRQRAEQVSRASASTDGTRSRIESD